MDASPRRFTERSEVHDREVYRGSTALILRSNGQLTGCSTPLGRRGICWEIAGAELRKYPHHTRQNVPWWLCRFFTTDVEAASAIALDLPTEERVERFGRPTLIEQFDSLPIEDFQQEFEGKFVDETYSFFPYELILPCTNDELVLYDEPTSVRAPEGRIVAGFDVGRTRDRSELAVFEEGDRGAFHGACCAASRAHPSPTRRPSSGACSARSPSRGSPSTAAASA